MSDGISHSHFFCVLYATDDVSYLSCRQLLPWHHVHLQHSNFIGSIFHSGVEELHFVALANCSVLNLEISNNASETVKHRVKDQCLKRSCRVALRMRNSFYYSIEHSFNTFSCSARSTEYVFSVTANEFNNLIFHFIGHSRWHVNFIYYWNYLQVMVDSHIQI